MTYPAGDQPGQPQQWTQPTQAAGGTISLQGRPGQWIALMLWVFAAIGMSLNFSSIGVASVSFGGASDATAEVGAGWQYPLLTNHFMLLTIAAIAAGVGVFRPRLKAPIASAYVVGGTLALAGGFGLLGWLIYRVPAYFAWIGQDSSEFDVVGMWDVGGWIIFAVALSAFVGAALEFAAGKKAAPEPVSGEHWAASPATQQWGPPAPAATEPEWVVESGPPLGDQSPQQPGYGSQSAN